MTPTIALAAPDPELDTLLDLLGDAVLRVDRHPDILLWPGRPGAPLPIGPTLNVVDQRSASDAPVPHGADLVLRGHGAAGPGMALVPRPLTPGRPAKSVRALLILLDSHPTPDLRLLADQAASWAARVGLPCGVQAEGPAGLALVQAFGPAPPPQPGLVLLDLRTRDDPAPLLDALATGAALLFADATPFRTDLERRGGARYAPDPAAALEALDLAPLSAGALAYVRTQHDRDSIAAGLRRTVLAALASRRRRLEDWATAAPAPFVLAISDEALNLVDLRVHLPLAALHRRGAIAGYALLRHGDFTFSTTPLTPALRFGAIWVQRSTDPLVHLLLRGLGQPFVYDLDDLLTVSPSYREPFPPEQIETVRALVRDCAVLSCATDRLARSLGVTDKTVVTPNLAAGPPRHVPGKARTLVWASSDKPALTTARAEIERAVRDVCRAHRLALLCIGAEPPPAFAAAGLAVEHVGLLSYAAYLARLQEAAPGILVSPLETDAEPATQAFIDAKSDIKRIEAARAGLIGVFSRAVPYAESDLPPAILCDNSYESWVAGLERALPLCARKAAPPPFPAARSVDGLGLLPFAEALRRAPTDLAAADITAALRQISGQAETLLTTPERFDEADYLRRHDDVREAVAAGTMASGYRHFVQSGFREGRAARRLPAPSDGTDAWWTRLLRTLSRLEAETEARDAEIAALRDRLRPRPTPPAVEPASVPTASLAAACPICDSPGPHAALLESLGRPLFQCRACTGCFYEDRTPYLYEDEAEAGLLRQLYLEQNAGIHQQTSLLFALEDTASLLDIGCGFGFTVDLARTILGLRATGLDPAAIAAAGRAQLGADIRQEYLTETTELPAPAGLVLASEVIEHLPEPYAFLALLRRTLAPSGTLVLTTPDASMLGRAIGPARTLCITAPRVHLVLFTQRALTLALQRAGFRHVQVTAQADSLLAFASDRPLRFRADSAAAHLEAYRAYLGHLLDHAEPASPLWNGAAGRLFTLLAPTAELTTLHALFARIAAAWRARYGIDLARLRLPALLPEAERRVTSAATLAASQPLNLAPVLLARALLEQRTPGHTPEQLLAYARPAWQHALQTGRILQAHNMIDHDLRQTAIRARMLVTDALAALAPEAAADLYRALATPSPGEQAEWLDPAPADLLPRLASAYASAVAADRFDDAAKLAPFVEQAELETLDPETHLRTRFALGVHQLLGARNPGGAHAHFTAMAEAARRHRRPDFLAQARQHQRLSESASGH